MLDRSIRHLLRQGLGVEDIAVRLGVPVQPIRQLMKHWQDSGEIKSILGMEAAGAGGKPATGLIGNHLEQKKDSAE